MKSRSIARVDDNHKEVVDCFRCLGASWQSTSTIPGALDGILGVAGIDQRVEIKDGRKFFSRRKLTEAEKETFDQWRGRRPVVVESTKDAEKLVAELRTEARANMGLGL